VHILHIWCNLRNMAIIVASLADKLVLCGLVATTYAGVLQLPIQAQHNVDYPVSPIAQAPLGRPIKV